MSQTAQQVITGALRFMRVLGTGETANADDSAQALIHLNDYLNGLNARGGTYANVALILTDAVPIAQELEGDLKRALARYMCADWQGNPMPRSDMVDCIKSDQRLLATFTTVDPAGSDGGLLAMPSQRRRAYITARSI